MGDDDAALDAWLLERGLRIEQARIARVRILLAIARLPRFAAAQHHVRVCAVHQRTR
jgi:hypothetical protein